MDTRIEIGRRFKKIREDLGLNQVEFAERVGISHQTHVGKIERGEGSPSIPVLQATRALSGYSIDQIISGPEYTVNGTSQYRSLIGFNNGGESTTALKALQLLESGILQISRSASEIRKLDAEKGSRIKNMQSQILKLKAELAESNIPTHA